MRFLIIGLPVLASFLACVSPVRGDAFTVEEWVLATAVYDQSTGESDLQGSTVVQNPFYETQFVSVGRSTAASAFDFSWTADSGTFLIEGSQQAEFVDSAFVDSRSSGGLVVSPSIDLTLELTGAYTYNLPLFMMAARFQVAVYDQETFETLFFDFHQDTSILGPVSGTFTIDDAITLPAGHSYVLDYQMKIISWTGPPAVFGSGTGFVNFQLIPEPATATLLLLPAAVLVSRRRKPRRRAKRVLPR